MSGVKPFTIPKDAVVKAWEKVKKNAGSHGGDQRAFRSAISRCIFWSAHTLHTPLGNNRNSGDCAC